MRSIPYVILGALWLAAGGCKAEQVATGHGYRVVRLSSERPRDKRYALELVQVRQDGAAVVRVGGAESMGHPHGTLFTDVREDQHVYVSGTDFPRQRVVLMVPEVFDVKRWFIVASSTPVPFLREWSE